MLNIWGDLDCLHYGDPKICFYFLLYCESALELTSVGILLLKVMYCIEKDIIGNSTMTHKTMASVSVISLDGCCHCLFG